MNICIFDKAVSKWKILTLIDVELMIIITIIIIYKIFRIHDYNNIEI